MKDARLLNLVLALILVVLIGWSLVVGRSIILPIAMALILVYNHKRSHQALAMRTPAEAFKLAA